MPNLKGWENTPHSTPVGDPASQMPHGCVILTQGGCEGCGRWFSLLWGGRKVSRLVLVFFKKICLFTYFGCAGSSLLHGLFSSCGKRGLLSRCRAWVSHCSDFCYGAWALGSQASIIVAKGLTSSVACGIFPDQELNPCPLRWQADSLLLSHWKNPYIVAWICETQILN